MKHRLKRITAALLAFLILLAGCAHRKEDLSEVHTSAPETETAISAPVPEAPSAETTAPQTLPPAVLETLPETQAPAHAPEPFSKITSSHAFIYHVNTGTALYAVGGPDQRIYPASLTKLFTAYVALQYLDPNEPVTAGKELEFVGKGSSVARIGNGSRLTVDTLIRAMLLPSGNDAAYVLSAAAGRAVAQDPNMDAADAVARFVEEMNAQARALELSGTHFASPDGYHSDDHYTTMADMARITALAMDVTLIRSCVEMSQEDGEFLSGETVTWRNTNELINPDSPYYRPNAMGIKTGYTKKAGYCLLSAFDVEGNVYIIGVFGCPEFYGRYRDTLYILDMLQ